MCRGSPPVRGWSPLGRTEPVRFRSQFDERIFKLSSVTPDQFISLASGRSPTTRCWLSIARSTGLSSMDTAHRGGTRSFAGELGLGLGRAGVAGEQFSSRCYPWSISAGTAQQRTSSLCTAKREQCRAIFPQTYWPGGSSGEDAIRGAAAAYLGLLFRCLCARRRNPVTAGLGSEIAHP